MYYQNFLKENNVTKFTDVKKLMEINNIIVKEDKTIPELYLVYAHRNDKKYEELTELERICNGSIYEKETNKLICASFNKFNKDDTQIGNFFNLEDENLNIFHSIQGSLIRVYFYNNKLYFATKKCIDAFRAFWSSKQSFGEMFRQCLEKLKNNNFNCEFYKNKNYFFIMEHVNNKSIFDITENILFHIMTYHLDTDKYVNEYIGINKPLMCDVRDKPTLEKMISMKNINSEGFILFSDKCGIIQKKIIFPEFKRLQDLYGNCKTRFFRFLQIQNNIDMVKQYLQSFPFYSKEFVEYEQKLILFCKKLHEMYLEVRVYKTPNYNFNKKYSKFLYNIHGLYLKNRQPITITDVVNYIKPLDAKLIAHLMNE